MPRERFAPVKTTNDLLELWSDAFEVATDARMLPSDAEANRARVIDLDPRYFGLIDELQARFPEGAPSLASCQRFTVSGDHRFGANVVLEGVVALRNDSTTQVLIESGTRLSGS